LSPITFAWCRWQGSDPAAEHPARWSRLSVTELETQADVLRRTWAACYDLPDLMLAIARVNHGVRVDEAGDQRDVEPVKGGGGSEA
jgi:hypothetical protein